MLKALLVRVGHRNKIFSNSSLLSAPGPPSDPVVPMLLDAADKVGVKVIKNLKTFHLFFQVVGTSWQISFVNLVNIFSYFRCVFTLNPLQIELLSRSEMLFFTPIRGMLASYMLQNLVAQNTYLSDRCSPPPTWVWHHKTTMKPSL